MAMTPTATPTPMPTSAPVERPPLELEGVVVAADEDVFEVEELEEVEEDAPVVVWYAVIVVSTPVPHW